MVLPAVEAMATLEFWQAAPNSEQSQVGLAYLSDLLKPVLEQPDIEASVSLPLCTCQHWTWLNYRRAAKPEGQSDFTILSILTILTIFIISIIL